MKEDRRFTITAVCAIVLGLGSAVLLLRWMDQHRPAPDAAAEEQLYVNAETARRISLGFNGLLADWYWMRSLQYVGHKIIDSPTVVPLDNLSSLRLTLLVPLLETSTTLDPQFLAPYEYAAMVLPSIDEAAAIRITKKGIAANPTNWKLYHYLGYISWQRKEFNAASQTYGEGAVLPGAPRWMEAIKAQLAAQGGSRDTALQIYARIYQESDDPILKGMARSRIMQIQSLNERDVIRRILSQYSARAHRCASSWAEVSEALSAIHLRRDASGAPIDPGDVPYQLNKTNCDVELDQRSPIPQK